MPDGREERRLTLAELEETLKDPELVYLNMLRGSIATPSIRQMLHLHGADALARWDSVEEIAALRAENAALIAAAPDLLAALSKAMSWIENWDVPFADDGEWLADKAEIRAALDAARRMFGTGDSK